MTILGDRSFLFAAVAVARARSARLTANAPKELVDLSLQYGLEHLADLLTSSFDGLATTANFG